MSDGPAFQMVSKDEARALRIAVNYALRSGLASDDLDGGEASNRSLVAVGKKLGCVIPEWCEGRVDA
jgi:hypothetical protein